MMKKTFLLLFALVLLPTVSESLAQPHVKRTTNHDLRTQSLVFSVKWEKQELRLESSVSGQYSLSQMKGDKTVKVWKIDKEAAQKFDDLFADNFIRLKYEMKESAEKKCASAFDLSMRGEEQIICEQENDKKSIVQKFIGELQKTFS